MTSHMASALASATGRQSTGGFRIFGQRGSPIGVDVKVVSTPGEGDPARAPIIKA
jgi:hypothetical protein